MNILIVSHYAGSAKHGMVYRYYYLARCWIEMGHRVRIVASSESHLRKLHPVVEAGVAFETIDGIEYVWVKTTRYKKNDLLRVVNMFSFVKSLFFRKGQILHDFDPDVVVGSCTYNFEIYAIGRYAKQYGATFVYDVRDLWPLTLYEMGGYSKINPFTFLVQKGEDAYCKMADIIVSVLSGAKRYLVSRGMDEHKFEFIPNGIYLEDWENPLPLTEEERLPIRYLREGYGTLVGYTGLHGVANALEHLIEVARMLKERDVGFILIGDGPKKRELQNLAGRYCLDNVVFLGYVDKEKIPAYLSEMDILYIGLNRQPIFLHGVSPNKLFDYMMSARPIVYSVDADNDLVLESGCGISCEAENSAAIADSVLKLMSLSESERYEMGRKGRDYVINNYAYNVLAKRYIDAIQSICNKKHL